MNAPRRVAITGIGALSPIGIGATNFWNGLLSKASGASKCSEEYSFLPCRVTAPIKDDLFKPHLQQIDQQLAQCDRKVSWRSISKGASFGLCAAFEALSQGGWHPSIRLSPLVSGRAGVHFGTGLEGLEEILQSGEAIRARRYRGLGPYALTKSLCNMTSGQISLTWGLRGFAMAYSTACASGLHSMGEAYKIIRSGEADMVVAGACESSILPWSVAAFSRLRALSTKYNDHPEEASRPFDADRDGFVMAEGAGAVVLQAWPPPKEITAELGGCVEPLAEIIGFGRSADAYDLVSPHLGGDGAYRSMIAALNDAGLTDTSELCHINCHASSTPLGDTIELAAVARLLARLKSTHPSCHPQVVINSVKGYIGHLMGAAGALESVYTAMAVARGQAIPNRNLHNPPAVNDLANILSEHTNLTTTEVDQALDCFHTQAILPKHDSPPLDLHCGSGSRRVALTNSFGFGGTNGTLAIAEWKD